MENALEVDLIKALEEMMAALIVDLIHRLEVDLINALQHQTSRSN